VPGVGGDGLLVEADRGADLRLCRQSVMVASAQVEELRVMVRGVAGRQRLVGPVRRRAPVSQVSIADHRDREQPSDQQQEAEPSRDEGCPGVRRRRLARCGPGRWSGMIRVPLLRIEDIAASANVPDRGCARLPECGTDITQALHQRVVSDRTALPDMTDELVLRDKPPAVFGQKTEQFIRLRPQVDRFATAEQRPAAAIERVIGEQMYALVSHYRSIFTQFSPGFRYARNRSALSSAATGTRFLGPDRDRLQQGYGESRRSAPRKGGL